MGDKSTKTEDICSEISGNEPISMGKDQIDLEDIGPEEKPSDLNFNINMISRHPEKLWVWDEVGISGNPAFSINAILENPENEPIPMGEISTDLNEIHSENPKNEPISVGKTYIDLKDVSFEIPENETISMEEKVNECIQRIRDNRERVMREKKEHLFAIILVILEKVEESNSSCCDMSQFSTVFNHYQNQKEGGGKNYNAALLVEEYQDEIFNFLRNKLGDLYNICMMDMGKDVVLKFRPRKKIKLEPEFSDSEEE